MKKKITVKKTIKYCFKKIYIKLIKQSNKNNKK